MTKLKDIIEGVKNFLLLNLNDYLLETTPKLTESAIQIDDIDFESQKKLEMYLIYDEELFNVETSISYDSDMALTIVVIFRASKDALYYMFDYRDAIVSLLTKEPTMNGLVPRGTTLISSDRFSLAESVKSKENKALEIKVNLGMEIE